MTRLLRLRLPGLRPALGLAALIAGCGLTPDTVPSSAGPPSAPAPLTAAEARANMSAKERHDRLVDYFPNVELITHTGRRVRFYDDLIFDRTVLINFMYTTCDGI